MRTGKDRVQVDAIGGSIIISGVGNNPGVIILADAD